MPKLILGRERRTNPLVWLAAIICAVLAVAVIITGLVVFIIYMVYQPRVPYIKVGYAQLLRLEFDQSGVLASQMVINLVAENDNVKADATFSNIDFFLKFHRITIAELRADTFEVDKNSSYPLNYIVESAAIPLDQSGMKEVDVSLKQGRVNFRLQGQAKTQWKVGVFVSAKFYTHLNCQLQFFTSNGSSIGPDCSSKSR